MPELAIQDRPPVQTARSGDRLLGQEVHLWLLAVAAIGAMTAWLALLGRPWLPEGHLRLWNWDLSLAHNSQHLADLHVSSGALIWALLRRFNPTLSGARLALAVAASAASWKAIENLPAVVCLFNPPASGPIYGGDSIVNALGDAAFACAGFVLAMKLSWDWLWLLIAAIELACAVLIGDGLLWGIARLAKSTG